MILSVKDWIFERGPNLFYYNCKGVFSMKCCPYCGVVLTKDDAVFCRECGKKLPANEKTEFPFQTDSPKKGKRRKQHSPIPEIVGEAVEDNYDGYYDDVLPPDLDRIREGVDRNLIKKIAILAVSVILVISLCVILLYMV